MAIGYVIAVGPLALHINFVRREVADRHADSTPKREVSGSLADSMRLVIAIGYRRRLGSWAHRPRWALWWGLIGVSEARFGTVGSHTTSWRSHQMSYACGCSSMVEPQ